MVTRRQLLLGTGTGMVGLALGASPIAAVFRQGAQDLMTAASATDAAVEAAVHKVVEQDRSTREAVGTAGPYGPPFRPGARRVIWSTTPKGAYAALTFDDGPTPEHTPRILDALAAAGVHATFYVMGYNAARHPELVREIVARGHELGNHTWQHLDQTTIGTAEIRREIVRCADRVEQLVQRPLIGFRPPRGELTGYAVLVCAELGYDVFLWSCTRDTGGSATASGVEQYVGSVVRAGDIVDLHDGLGRGTFAPRAAFTRGLAARREAEVQALPGALHRIADRGITLTTTTDLLSRSAS